MKKKIKKRKPFSFSKRKKNLIKGVLSIHPKRGFGFVRPDIEFLESFPFDIFIPYSELKGALDGDTVLVSIFTTNTSVERKKGSIIEVISRGKEHILGIIVSLNESLKAEIFIPSSKSDRLKFADLLPDIQYRIGDRILLETPQWKANYNHKNVKSLKMISFIGNIDDPQADFASIKAEYNLIEEFPPEVLEETKSFSQKHIAQSLNSRKDLRNLLCFTIDSSTARDFDDAVSLTKDEEDNYILGVHIADVSNYVAPNTALDIEASKRCNSVYFPNKVIPMLPSTLSDELCSLKPNVDRLAVSVFMTFSQEGFLIDYNIFKSVIQSKYRMTYDEVDDIIQRKTTHPIADVIQNMFKLSSMFTAFRENRGCIRFSLPSFSMQLDTHQEPIDIIENFHTDSRQLIEEFMLKANEVVAYHIDLQGVLFPYRIHEEPNEENLASFRTLTQNLGLEIDLSLDQEYDYQNFLHHKALNHPLEQVLNSQFVRSMKTAFYSVENKGHYGLKLDYYTHFTSPIRRYADLIVHRLLFNPSSLANEKLEFIVQTCSSVERSSAKAEQSLILLKKLRFMKKCHQKNPDAIYEGLIISANPEGLSITIPKFFQESFIAKATLPKEYHIAQKKNFQELPTHLKPGSTIKIKIASINLISQDIEWAIIPPICKVRSDTSSKQNKCVAKPKKRRTPIKKNTKK